RPEQAARVLEIRRQLADARALHAAGRYPVGLAVASTALAQARAVGYAPVEALAMLRTAYLFYVAGEWATAAELARHALPLAHATRSDEVKAGASALPGPA